MTQEIMGAPRPQVRQHEQRVRRPEVADDVVGKPILLSPEPTRVIAEAKDTLIKGRIESTREQLMKDPLHDAGTLTAELGRLNEVLRDLRLKRKEADGFFVRFSQSGRARLSDLDQAIEKVRYQCDDIEADMEALLPPEAQSKQRKSHEELSSKERVGIARERIGDVLNVATVNTEEYKPKFSSQFSPKTEILSRRDELRADRERLQKELGSIKFWQFGKLGRKREIADEVREIDRKMSSIINADRGL